MLPPPSNPHSPAVPGPSAQGMPCLVLMANAQADAQEHKSGCAGSSYLVSRNAVTLVSGRIRLGRHAGDQHRPTIMTPRKDGGHKVCASDGAVKAAIPQGRIRQGTARRLDGECPVVMGSKMNDGHSNVRFRHIGGRQSRISNPALPVNLPSAESVPRRKPEITSGHHQLAQCDSRRCPCAAPRGAKP